MAASPYGAVGQINEWKYGRDYQLQGSRGSRGQTYLYLQLYMYVNMDIYEYACVYSCICVCRQIGYPVDLEQCVDVAPTLYKVHVSLAVRFLKNELSDV